MTRTASRLDSDQQYQDMMVPLSGIDFVALGGTAATYTKVAAGEYSLRLTAAATAYTTASSVTGLIYRQGVQPDYQQAFGSSRAGGAIGLPVGWPQTISTASTVVGATSIAVFSSVNFVVGAFITVDTVGSGVQEFAQVTAIPDATHLTVTALKNAHATPFPVTQNIFTSSGPAQGRPPFTGLTQLTPPTAAFPKGINIKQITMNYIVNTAAASVPTVGLFATQYVHNSAPVITALIALATNNLQTAVGQYSVPVPVPVANQGFIVTPNTVVSVEFDITTGAAATVDVTGCTIWGSYNYN